MENTQPAMTATDQLDASFDIVARQDMAEAAIAGLRGDVDEVKSRLDKVARAAARPAIGATSAGDTPEMKGFVDGYLRRGRETELKSISGVSPADGGYAVPRQIDAMIASTLADISPIRAIAQVVQTGTAGYRKLVATGGVASGWVSEVAPRPETGTPKFAEIAPPSGDLYANPAASQAMLDDAAFDIETWLASEIALGSGSATGFDSAPDSRLIDLIHSLKSGHRQGAVFVMNSATLATVRKLKTADGAFLWQPGMVECQPDRLLGYPVIEAEDMPDVAGGAFPIAFGNFRHGYLIAENGATSVLRDPFTNKPFVHFYATKRVGGKVLDSNAIKLLKIEA